MTKLQSHTNLARCRVQRAHKPEKPISRPHRSGQSLGLDHAEAQGAWPRVGGGPVVRWDCDLQCGHALMSAGSEYPSRLANRSE